MRTNRLRGLLTALVSATILVAPASAESKSLEQKYTDLRVAVVKKFGVKTAGRNIRKQGIKTPNGRVLQAEGRHLGRSIRTYRRWLAPPAPQAMPGDRTPVGRIASQPSYTGGRWAIPRYIVMCESGGNYRALNPSGAGGAYQIMPATWHRYGGTGAPHLAAPAEQDRIAGRIYAAEGAGPWTCR